jgi:Holliday junction DNA helicase RuvB
MAIDPLISADIATVETKTLILQDSAEDRSPDFVPRTFDDYIGQHALKEKLSVYTQAAKMRGEPLDHLLLFGPPGLGKTTLSQIMASVMAVNIKICSGPMLERTGDLVAILSSLETRDILFIDEIHRLPAPVEEVLYSAMEHFRVDVIIGQGAGAKSVNFPIAAFTLIGATTKSGMISAPLRSRFGINERLDFYSDEELRDIVIQNALFLQVTITPAAAQLVGSCARGTPRIAKKLLRRVRDFAQVRGISVIDEESVAQALNFLGIDTDGLTKLDNLLLRTLIEQFNGGPAGLDTLASITGEDAETLESVIEPFLLRQGYLQVSSRGRIIGQAKQLYLRKKFFGQQMIG